MKDKKLFITDDNVSKFAKIQNTVAMADRDDVVIMWDELDKKGKKLAREHINIPDVEVRSKDPYKVPDKWNDNTIKLDSEPDASDLIKQVIANPSRSDVYELLTEVDPPEPLMLWWADVCFSDDEYFRLLSDVCRYGLFRTDTRYLWAVMAYGVEPGKGKFHWPSSGEDIPAEEKKVKKKIIEEYDIRQKELDKAWDDIKGLSHNWVELDEDEAEKLGVEDAVEGDEEEADREESTSSLLDF